MNEKITLLLEHPTWLIFWTCIICLLGLILIELTKSFFIKPEERAEPMTFQKTKETFEAVRRISAIRKPIVILLLPFILGARLAKSISWCLDDTVRWAYRNWFYEKQPPF